MKNSNNLASRVVACFSHMGISDEAKIVFFLQDLHFGGKLSTKAELEKLYSDPKEHENAVQMLFCFYWENMEKLQIKNKNEFFEGIMSGSTEILEELKHRKRNK